LSVAGVVDHDVKRAEVIMSLLDGGKHGAAVGDVELEREQRVAVLGLEVVQC
jgi:hypothetical protein